MIKFENTEVLGWEAAIRGMRMPKESFDRSDSIFAQYGTDDLWDINNYHMNFGQIDHNVEIGPNDHRLMMSLAKGGSVHAKYRRMIQVYVDITAPLGFWHDFDTYRIGTAKNSASRRNAILTRPFTIGDFTTENLSEYDLDELHTIIDRLNFLRNAYLREKDAKIYRAILDKMPTCYNQKATWMGNYEVLVGVYHQRKNHFYSEFHDMCCWIKSLPYSEIIIGDETNE